MIAGNKMDLSSTHREVRIEDVSEWVFCTLPKLRWVVVVGLGIARKSRRHVTVNLIPSMAILKQGEGARVLREGRYECHGNI